MEKSIVKNNFILIISFSSFFFFWDNSILNFQLRFLILLPLITILFSNYFITHVFNIKFIIFLIMFVHLLYNADKHFIFFSFASFVFLFSIAILIAFTDLQSFDNSFFTSELHFSISTSFGMRYMSSPITFWDSEYVSSSI